MTKNWVGIRALYYHCQLPKTSIKANIIKKSEIVNLGTAGETRGFATASKQQKIDLTVQINLLVYRQASIEDADLNQQFTQNIKRD